MGLQVVLWPRGEAVVSAVVDSINLIQRPTELYYAELMGLFDHELQHYLSKKKWEQFHKMSTFSADISF